MNGRRIYHARGKVLGGSSSINGMIFQRGNPMDYDRWAADPGMETWDFRHCLPYFKRMESLRLQDGSNGADDWRGGDGPLVLERGPAENPLFAAFFEAAQQAGYPLTDDVNGYRQEGFAPFDRNIKDSRRWSAARAYLHPAMRRPNLRVETLAHVTKVNFSGKSRDRSGLPARWSRGALRLRRRGDPVRRRDQQPPAPAALRGRRPGSARGVRHPRRPQPPRRRREPPGPPRGLHPVRRQAARLDRPRAGMVEAAQDRAGLAVLPQGRRGAPTTSRAAVSPAPTTR